MSPRTSRSRPATRRPGRRYRAQARATRTTHDAAWATRLTGVPVLINPDAGGRLAGSARRLLELLRDDPGVTLELVPPPLMAERVRAASQRHGVVAVAGGDGTLRTAAEALAGTRTALLPLPGGRVNTFARRTGIETLEDGVRRLRAPGRMAVPVGVANDRVFLNTATFGLYARVVRQRNRIGRWIGRWPAAAIAFTLTLARLDRFDLEITMPHAQLRRSTPLLWVRSLWREEGGPHLEVVIFHLRDRAAAAGFMLRRGPSLLRGAVPAEDDRLEVLHTRSLIVRAPHVIDMTLDGEPFRVRPPVFVSMEDDALAVVADGAPVAERA